MNDIEDPESSGETGEGETAWPSPPGNGNWTPPPPPGWGQAGWRDPGVPGWRDPAAPGWRDPAAPGWQDQGPPPPPGGGGYPGSGPYGYWGPHPGGWGGPPAGGPSGWYGWAPGRPRRTLPSAVTALLLVVAVLVGLGIGHGVWSSSRAGIANPQNGSGSGNGFGFNPFGGSNSNNGGGIAGGQLTGPTAAAANALVDIDTTLSYQNGAAAGTGIVLTPDGYVLTNNHVISGATSISATDIGSGQKYTATVVGYDRSHDVALLKLQGASGLRTASLGNSAKVTLGETVVGLGNAGGVGGTPSSAPGQVTAVNQTIKAQDESNGTTEQLTGLIETNSNIQPGDSGGALVDSNGQVIGVDTAASTGFSFQTQGNQGFAIPINQATSLSDQIRAGKASATIHIGPTAFLGVEIDTTQGSGGALVSRILPGGAAAAAGVVNGSVITSLGGASVDSPAALTNLIGHYHPGDRVSIGWTGPGGQSHTTTVTLASGPAA
jgi:S1-C subfamily serine protease